MCDIEDIVSTTFSEKTHNICTNLAYEYDDMFEEADIHNPYYKLPENTKKMNVVAKPGDIPEPLHPNFANLDKDVLRKCVIELLDEHNKVNLNNITFEKTYRDICRKYKVSIRKIDMYYMYRIMCNEKKEQCCNIIRGLLQTNSVRSQSGVMVYTVFTHPFYKYGNNGQMHTFSCNYNCRFCPDMPGYPRSYVPGEPGNDRAHAVKYDTVAQIYNRATAYSATGHINDKAEVLVLGGTWHSYPLKYRRQFITLLYYGFNTIHENRDRPVMTLEDEIKLNEKSKCRVIGLTIETRPDQITPNEIIELRCMGVTRLQLGVQHTNVRLLNRIQRQCTPKHAIDAIRLLKDSCFKVDIHLMPDLPKPFLPEFEEQFRMQLNSKDLVITKDDIDWNFDSLKEDELMFEEVLQSDTYCPDQIKIYPCEVMDWTGIKNDFTRGCHIPYGTLLSGQKTNELIELLIRVQADFPETCRINRIKRDIPIEYNLGGLNDTSGRQTIENLMKKRGIICRCIRCREIKKKSINPKNAQLKIIHYSASEGDEYFMQYVTQNDELIGFLRLRVSSNSGEQIYHTKNGIQKVLVCSELVSTALIRELHVYGEAVTVNKSENGCKTRTQQHVGFGTKLLENAFSLALSLGYTKIAVISGVGVKEYYRKFGFHDGDYYMIKNIDIKTPNKNFNIIHKTCRFGNRVYSKHYNLNDKKQINYCKYIHFAIIILGLFFIVFLNYYKIDIFDIFTKILTIYE